MNGKPKKIAKGTVSNSIAWIFIVLQVLLMLGGLYAGRSPHEGENISFHNTPAVVQSVMFLFGMNVLGIGALVLSLIVWLYHANKKGKATTITSAVVIIVNTLFVI